jgi:hypothetical protein
MPSTRRPTYRSLASPLGPPLGTSAETAGSMTHDPGLQGADAYALSPTTTRPAFVLRTPAIRPVAPLADASMRDHGGGRAVPPAVAVGPSFDTRLTKKCLAAWAAEPGQSPEEKQERAAVVRQLVYKKFLRKGVLRRIVSLSLSGSRHLTSLPEGLSVPGDLWLRGCTSLRELPEGLTAGNNLFLAGCTALTWLPEGLSVGNVLTLEGCTALTYLADRMFVGGDFCLRGCTSLTHLPEVVLQWPLRPNGMPHIIDVSGSGIDEERLQALARALGPGVQLNHGVVERRQTGNGQFSNLCAAMAFWQALTPSGSRIANLGDETAQTLHADPGQLEAYLLFLGRLRRTADFQNISSRPLLAQRIVGLTEQVAASESLAALCHERIGQALESCSDRVIWAMNQLELTVRVHQAQQGRAPEQQLRSLGRSLLRLQVVHQHAAAKVASLRVVDPIEVYLAFETRLAQPLGLPLSTQGMLYERTARVSAADLGAASQAARLADADPQQVDAYLATWEPWQAHLRRQQAENCTWQQLPSLPPGVEIAGDETCVLTQETVAELRASGNDVAAVRDANGRWEPYSFAALLKWWTQQGTHPVQLTPMSLAEFCRLDVSAR